MIVYCSQFTKSEFCGHTISLSNNTEIKKKKIKKAERPGNCLNPGCMKSVLQIHVLITSTSSGALNLPVICEALPNTAEWSHGID